MKKLNKNNLETGMLAVTRDGKVYVVMLGVENSGPTNNIIVSDSGYMPLSRYSKELKLEDSLGKKEPFDIVKVYKKKGFSRGVFDTRHAEVIMREDRDIDVKIRELKVEVEELEKLRDKQDKEA